MLCPAVRVVATCVDPGHERFLLGTARPERAGSGQVGGIGEAGDGRWPGSGYPDSLPIIIFAATEKAGAMEG